MKEMISTHDDLDKRLAIFFGLGALILSALVGLVRNYTLEGILLQGVVVLVIAILAGYFFGIWLRSALASVEPTEELPSNMERRRTNAASLDQGTVIVPDASQEAVISEEAPDSVKGSVFNYTLPELNPADLPAPMSAPAAREPEPVRAADETGDLPPPPVPSWLK